PTAPAPAGGVPRTPFATAATKATQAGRTVSQFAAQAAATPGAQLMGQLARGAGVVGAASNVGRAMLDDKMSTPEKAIRAGVGMMPLVPGLQGPGLAANAAVMAADTIPINGQTVTERLRAWFNGPAPQPVGQSGATPPPTGNQLVDQIPGYTPRNAAPVPTTTITTDPKTGQTVNVEKTTPQSAPAPKPSGNAGAVAKLAQQVREQSAPAPVAPVSSRATHYDPTKPYDPNDSTTWAPVQALVGNKAFMEAYDPATGVYQKQDNVAPLTAEQLKDPSAVLAKVQELAFAGRGDEATALLKGFGIDAEIGGRKDVAEINKSASLGAASIDANARRDVQNAANAGGLAVAEANHRYLPIQTTTDPTTGRETSTKGYLDARTRNVVGGAETERKILPSKMYEQVILSVMKQQGVNRATAEQRVARTYDRGE
ncbi:MAG: hypothetical protein ACM3H9_00130, partial [Rhodospirillaceae bacterium]